MKCVVVDTNILMYIYLMKVDIFSELRELGFTKILIPDCVIEELEIIKDKFGGKYSKAARFALTLIKKEKVEIVKTEKKIGTDEKLLEISIKNGCILLTNDRELRKKAKNMGIEVGYIREKNRIVL